MPRARALAEGALVLAPNLAEAWATLASVSAQYDRDLPRAEAAWARALAAQSRHVRSRGERALWARCFGALHADEAVARVGDAVADDPLNACAVSVLCFVRGVAGCFDEALEAGEQAVEMDPESFIAQWMLLQAVAGSGDEARALAQRDSMVVQARHMLQWDTLRADPRFEDVVRGVWG